MPLELKSGDRFLNLNLGGRAVLAQLLDRVEGCRLYDVITASFATRKLVDVAHAFGTALGHVSCQLGRARPAVPRGCRILSGCDHLALASSLECAALGSMDDRVAAWDIRHVERLAGNLSFIADAPTAALVAEALRVHAAHVQPHYAATEAAVADGSYRPDALDSTWRLSWIHGDANNHNVMVRVPNHASTSDGAPAAEAAAALVRACDPSSYVFIDWEDASFSYAVHDVAISLTYLILDAGGLGDIDANAEAGAAPSPVLDAACAFVRAVSSVCPLKPSEASALPALVVSRLATSLLQSSKAAAAADSEAQREYILVHAGPAAALLRALLAPGAVDAMSARMLAACGLTTTVARPPRSYVYRPHVSLEQARCSALVASALQWLGTQAAAGAIGSDGAQSPLHPVIRHDTAFAHVKEDEATGSGDDAATAAAGAGKTGWVPRAAHFPSPPGASWWPRPPFVYDFGAGNDELSGVVGTDPDKLARFTDMMFQPLAPPPAPAQPIAPGAGADAAASPLAPAAPACTPLYTASPAGAPADGAGVFRIGWGQYGEARVLYQSEHFVKEQPAGEGKPPRPEDEPRTVHLGVDLEAPAGTPVHAPLAGVVHSVARNLHPLDYGPCVILRHTLRVTLKGASASDSEGEVTVDVPFFTLYGHLSVDTLVGPDGSPRLREGQAIPAGGVVGWVGPEAVNGGWPPHLHFQVNTELGHGGWQGDYPGVCAAGDWPVYAALCPDPNLLLRCPHVAPVGQPWGCGDVAAVMPLTA